MEFATRRRIITDDDEHGGNQCFQELQEEILD
jgi:hypothetical protein